MEIVLLDKILTDEHTMFIQKVRGGEMFSTKDTWNVLVLDSITPLDGGETKDEGKQDFMDEHGVDVFDANNKFLKAFDVEIPLACFGTSPADCRQKKETFLRYLRTNGILHHLYLPFFQQGRTNVEYKSISDIRFIKGASDCLIMFKLKLTINDPVSEVTKTSQGLTISA